MAKRPCFGSGLTADYRIGVLLEATRRYGACPVCDGMFRIDNGRLRAHVSPPSPRSVARRNAIEQRRRTARSTLP
jgi:hypothetical protein